jgi:hypothetical protein
VRSIIARRDDEAARAAWGDEGRAAAAGGGAAAVPPAVTMFVGGRSQRCGCLQVASVGWKHKGMGAPLAGTAVIAASAYYTRSARPPRPALLPHICDWFGP